MVSSSASRSNGRGCPKTGIRMVRSSEPAPMLVSGAIAKPPAVAPALAGADRDQEAADVGRHLRRHAPGQDRLELLPGEGVLPLEKEGVGELKTDTEQTGIRDQHLPEGRDRFVEQGVAAVFVGGRGGSLDGSHALPEQGLELIRVLVVRGREGGGREGERQNQGGQETAHRSCSGRGRNVAPPLNASTIGVRRSLRSTRPWGRSRMDHTRLRTCRRSRAAGRLWFPQSLAPSWSRTPPPTYRCRRERRRLPR